MLSGKKTLASIIALFHPAHLFATPPTAQAQFAFAEYIRRFASQPTVRQLAQFTQHGSTSCLLHSVAVAYFSVRLARFLHLHVREREMIRGALLHDYFLYDWHIKDPKRPAHATHHPLAALKNAERDFTLTDVEKDVICKHMFPVTPKPPRCREGWMVTLADKGCGLYETLCRKNAYRKLRRRCL